MDRRGARRGQRGAERDRAEDPRWRHRPHLRRHVRPADPRGRHSGRGRRRPARPGPGQPGRHARRDAARRARSGHRLHRARQDPALRARPLRRRSAAAVDAGPDAHRRGQPHHLPAAARRRGQAEPARPALLRPAAPRRAAQPGDQRHRQRRPEPAADPEPAAHLAAHRRRDDRDDDVDLAAAGPARPGDDPDHDGRDRDDRQAQPEALRAAVEEHRRGQRRGRGDLHRARAGQGLRPPGGGRPDVRRAQRRALPLQLPGPVHQRHHHADDDVHREPQLRRHRGRRRAAGRLRHDEPGRRAGLHPVLAPVHPAADPGGLDVEPDAERGRIGRAGVRRARRPRAGARRRAPGAPSRTRAGGSRSRTSRSPTATTPR